ncbi:hypothetical protein PybrP1_006955, partial [[Pythium] brassicae (nom. inval.)]
TRFQQALRRLGGPQQLQLPADELLKRYPPAAAAAAAAAVAAPSHFSNATSTDAFFNTPAPNAADLDTYEFYRDFAAAPADVNAQRDAAMRLARAEHGDAYVDKVLYSHATTHHEWRKRRQFDFRLQPREAQRLAREGVVVAQRLRAESFAEGYYRLYTDDLPVYVTADSLLHAWHRSFDAALVDIETLECLPVLARVLRAASARCHELLAERAGATAAAAAGEKEEGDDRYTRVLLDVDLFLAVALRLLPPPPPPASATEADAGAGAGAAANANATSGATSPRFPANAARAAALERAIEARQTATVTLFGSARDIDFSLFQPRGHYAKSEELARYFQAMTWLGTIDFRVAGSDASALADASSAAQSELRQLQCAVVLVGLLRQDGGVQALAALDALVSSLVGDGDVGADSLTPMQLDALLPALSPSSSSARRASCVALLKTYVDVAGGAAYPPALLALQQEIVAKGLGAQLIYGHPAVESDSRSLAGIETEGGAGPPTSATASVSPTALPAAFTFFGQRFVWSAFIFSRLVFDQVVHAESKVVRRLPSAVDVGFALLANDAAGAIAAQRMQQRSDSDGDSASEQAGREEAELRRATEFVRLRDGVPYASNLIALREAIDAEFDGAAAGDAGGGEKRESVSTLWLRALRQLSTPSANAAPIFHSQTWQLRQLNTQLASFAQLRHDSLLYAKQSYTIGTRCEYAAGFVDPYPAFYASMRALAERMAAIVANLTSPSVVGTPSQAPLNYEMRRKQAMRPTMKRLKARAKDVFTTFADTMTTLEEIARRQALKQPLSDEQTNFVKTVMEERFGSGETRYAGWYPQLFYTKPEDAGERDVLVADVHTDAPSVEHGDPFGGVLHVGVGDVHFGFFAVDGAVYSGPVFSSYEFVTPTASERLDDDAFKDRLADAAKAPSTPDWALRSFLC